MQQLPPYRRTRAFLSPFSLIQIHMRNPWVVAFFSFAYPGFGYLIQQRLAKAFILIVWEIFINNSAKINLGIMYTLLGHFDQAKEVLDERWLMLYVPIYFFAIWDSYRSTVDMNKLYLLADREDAKLLPMSIGTWDINYLDKRKPFLAFMWSVIGPGLGHLYVHKFITGIFIFAYSISLIILSHLPLGLHYSLLGEFDRAKAVLDMQWLLYLPSIFSFIFYDAYNSAVELNKLFSKEQSGFLRENFQNESFEMPF